MHILTILICNRVVSCQYHQCIDKAFEMRLTVVIGFSVFCLVQLRGVSAEECASPPTGDQRQLQYTVTHVLLYQEYPRCSSIDFSYQHLIGEIWDETNKLSCARDKKNVSTTTTCMPSSCCHGVQMEH